MKSIDLNVLNQFDTAKHELIEVYLSTTPPRLKQIATAFYLKDFKSLMREAEVLRANSSLMGAELMMDLASKILLCKPMEEEEKLRTLIKEIHLEFSLIKEILSKEL